MKLNVLERIGCLGLLPKEGNFITLKITNELTNNLSFSEKELAELDFKNNGSKLTWNIKADKNKDIPIGDKAKEIIKLALIKLDKEEKLTADLISIYEKFVDKG